MYFPENILQEPNAPSYNKANIDTHNKVMLGIQKLNKVKLIVTLKEFKNYTSKKMGG